MLERALNKCWKDNVDIYALAPLRRKDVAEAAATCSIDPEAFLDEVRTRDVVSFAIKPISLRFLLRTYSMSGGSLPSSQVEIYTQGCKWLCKEHNERRQAARQTGRLDVEERIAAAARLAAVTVFCNRPLICKDGDAIGLNAAALPFDAFYGPETVRGRGLHVDAEVVAEILSTGLFATRGTDYMGWSHQSYAEFLAADYLARHGVGTKQVLSLINGGADTGGKPVPQLQEVAAWLASTNRDVRHALMRSEPETALRVDPAATDGSDRAALVDELLKLEADGLLRSFDRGLYLRFHRLAHSGLTERLRPYVVKSSPAKPSVRSLAIDLARVCGLRTLQTDLLEVVLDTSQPVHVREDATRALRDVADRATVPRLRVVALTPYGNDPDDSIKGNALRALWPEHITADELFAAVTRPKRSDLLGSYRLFLMYELAPGLQPRDLPAALAWLRNRGGSIGLGYDYEKVAAGILARAYEHLEQPQVLDLVGQVLLAYATEPEGHLAPHRMEETIREILAKEIGKRRAIILRLAASLDESNQFYVLDLLRNLVESEDIVWLIEQTHMSSSERERRQRSQVVQAFFNRNSVEHVNAILEVAQDPAMAELFSQFVKPVDLTSPESQQLRDHYHRYVDVRKRRLDEIRLVDPPPDVRIAELLHAFESGTLDAWWRLNMEMTLEPDSQVYGNEGESDLRKLYGWQHADANTRQRIIRAAEDYLRQSDPHTSEWLGTSIFHWPACGGFRALHLLLTESPDTLTTLPSTVWEKWAPILLAYPSSTQDGGTQRTLVRLCYERAPQQILDTALRLSTAECQAKRPLLFLDLLEECWDSQLGARLLAHAQGGGLSAECIGELLRYLLRHRVSEAKSWAESLVRRWRRGEKAKALALAAAGALLLHADDAGWPAIWQLLQKDRATGRELLLATAYQFHLGRGTVSIHTVLSERQLADLFLWLAAEFPYSTDPTPNGYMGERHFVGQWRDQAVQVLTQRGTPEAVAELQRLAREQPDLPWLKSRIVEADAQMRQTRWIPPDPPVILRLATDSRARVVGNGESLLDVLLESLGRLQDELQRQETPAIIDLWNVCSGKQIRYWPKDENHLSDYIKRFFDRDVKDSGIIVNREVEVRRPHGTAKGQRTDIHVDAFVRDGNGAIIDTITAVIEVKGCWHRERDTAMGTQLVRRYLRDNAYRYGVYVVGRFNCDAWDSRDPRKKKALLIRVADAQSQYDAQAVELSQGSVKVRAFVLDASIPSGSDY